jgi:hypothetical protein
MAECQSRGMEGLPRGYALDSLGFPTGWSGNPAAAASRIHRITNDGVTHMFQMNPDLMGAPGMELEAEKVHDAKSGDHAGIGPRCPPLW